MLVGELLIVNDVSSRTYKSKSGSTAVKASPVSTAELCSCPSFCLAKPCGSTSAKDVHAILVEVLTPAPERVTPRARCSRLCGGCHYQHAPYEYQLARKVEILREQLRRVGKIEFEGEIGVISGPPLGYRNRAQFHIAKGKIGYLAARSHELVPVDGECPISSPRLNQALAEMRGRLSDPRFPRFVQSVEIFTNETDVQVNAIETDRPVARSFYEWCESTVADRLPDLVRHLPRQFRDRFSR